MTEEDSRKATKYFCEGVRVGIWCYSGNGNWALYVNRITNIQFLCLDSLKWALVNLLEQVNLGNKELELREQGRHDDAIIFASASDAMACVAAIREAVNYIEEHSKENDWRDVTLSDTIDSLLKSSSALPWTLP